jgi:hypothetical protein
MTTDFKKFKKTKKKPPVGEVKPKRRESHERPPSAQRPSYANIRPYFTTRNGRRIYAADYGYGGWPIGKGV